MSDPRKLEITGFWESTVAKLKLKGIDGRAPPGLNGAAQLDSTPENSPRQKRSMMHRLNVFADGRKGGAWPPPVREVICLVCSDNVRNPFARQCHASL